MSQIYVPNSGGIVPLGPIIFNADSDTFAVTANDQVNIIGGTGIQVLGDDAQTLTISATGGGQPVTPLKEIRDFDDFISSSENSKMDWVYTSFLKNEGTASNPGQLVLNTFNTYSLICFSSFSDLGNPWQLGGGSLSNSWVIDLVTLSTGGQSYIAYFGISDNNDSWSTGTPVNGCFFQYTNSVNGGDWQIKCISGGIATTVNTSIAATTGFHNYTVQINANATLATFYIDGVSIGTISTNIPTSPLGPTVNVEATLGNVVGSIIDLWYYSQELTAARPGDQGGGGGGGSPGSGDVTGPGVSTDNALVRWDGITGTLIQDSVANLSDVGELSGLTGLTATGSISLTGPMNFTGAITGPTSLTVTGPTTLSGGQTVKVASAVGASYITTSADFVILVNGAVTPTVQPLAVPPTGKMYRIKDSAGTAASNNITITPIGKNIDGSASTVINVNYGSVDIVYNGTEWNIV